MAKPSFPMGAMVARSASVICALLGATAFIAASFPEGLGDIDELKWAMQSVGFICASALFLIAAHTGER